MLTKKTQGGYDKPFINTTVIISNEWSILEWRTGIAFFPMQSIDLGKHHKDKILGCIQFAYYFINIYIGQAKKRSHVEPRSHHLHKRYLTSSCRTEK